MSVPSQTPYVHSVARQDKQLIPVFDLAERLGVEVRGSAPLCLIAKQAEGPMAIRVDEDVPSLATVEVGAIRPSGSHERDVVGSFQQGDQEVPIYALDKLGQELGSGRQR
jgi:chemotaxis signal transduction protein